jgi:hypothetical protein
MHQLSGVEDILDVGVRGQGVPILIPENVNVDERDARIVRLPQAALGRRQDIPIRGHVPEGVTVVEGLECRLLGRGPLHHAVLLLVVLGLGHLFCDARR